MPKPIECPHCNTPFAAIETVSPVVRMVAHLVEFHGYEERSAWLTATDVIFSDESTSHTANQAVELN